MVDVLSRLRFPFHPCPALAVVAWFLLALPAPAEDPVTVFVELEGPSLAEMTPAATPRRSLRLHQARNRERRSEIDAHHDELRVRLPVDAEFVGRHAALLNALALRVPAARLEELRRLPGVRAITPSLRFRRQSNGLGNAGFVRASDVWRAPAGLGLTGKGMKIGIVDGGIDYYHADFGGAGAPGALAADNPRVVEAGTFPTAKVAGGRDFVGETYDPFGSSSARVPRPDPDPIDSFLRYHGTHVAGIAAGYGVTADGRTFRGDYSTLEDVSTFRIPPGIAPEAELYSLKVFGVGDVDASPVISALEWALDPDQDGDFSDHLDVVNLSLSTTFGYDFGNQAWENAVNRISALGVVVVGSAGNGGDTGFVTGPPALAERAISVAAAAGDVFHQNIARFHGVSDRAWTIPTLIDAGPAPLLADFTPITAPVVPASPVSACSTLANASALAGRVAMVTADGCAVPDKIRRVQNAGATAVLLILPHNGVFADYRSAGTPSDLRIPVLGINQRLGNALVGRIATSNAVSVDLYQATAENHPEWVGLPAHLSSRGPSSSVGRLKPDIAAPGYGITSARAGTGFDRLDLSGTSMAAPQVAGAVALVLQAHPEWSPEDVKAALMNAARPMQDRQGRIPSPTWVGAGLLDVAQAISAPVLARADGTNGQVSLSFGLLDGEGPWVVSRRLRVTNRLDRAVTLQLAISNAVHQAGARLTPSVRSLSLPPHGTFWVDFELAVDPLGFTARSMDPVPDGAGLTAGVDPRTQPRLPEGSGDVWLREAEGETAVHVPWHVVVKPRASFDLAANRVGVPGSATSTLPLPTRGGSGHELPLVGTFLWGAAGTRIAAVGAASDFLRTGSLDQTTLYFGLALATPWQTPQHPIIGAAIEIDVNDDNRVDYTLLNANETGLVYLDPLLDGPLGEVDDRFRTLLRDENRRTNHLTTASTLNVLPPSLRDTSPFLTSTLVHAVSASSIGLSSNRSRFRYRANYNTGVERTAWVTFDARKPVIDPSPYGLLGSPLQDEGRAVRVGFSRDDAVSLGFGSFSPPKALLLHLHNDANQADVVTLDLADPDVDRDGMPDVWELATFGDLAADASSDADADGTPDLAEFLAGTPAAGLRIKADWIPGQGLRISWPSVASRRYSVERADALAGPFWVLGTRSISATPPVNALFVTPTPGSSAGASFLRLRLD